MRERYPVDLAIEYKGNTDSSAWRLYRSYDGHHVAPSLSEYAERALYMVSDEPLPCAAVWGMRIKYDNALQLAYFPVLGPGWAGRVVMSKEELRHNPETLLTKALVMLGKFDPKGTTI